MRIGLLGGTFSPPHHGHLICAQEARIQLDLDEVWLVPAGDPPHREIEDDPGPEQRLNMCRLAVIGQPGLSISTVEIHRDGPSFTVDTLRGLVAEHPQTEFTLVIGADQALSFGNWREPEEIGRMANIAVAARTDADRGEALAEITRVTDKEPLSIDMPRIDISSSMIRENIRDRETITHFVPAGIAELIEQSGLYR
ncbi:MAG TPA: nicotinate-nucleotide adenylyltransferase [Solirubrobacterales bacterium]|jgi:nicotinate-nucleotide adenylyltransferase|nr:nicotinate-nucleotide adenylyltransferase [Solirubrobacterales bacterium]